MHKEMSLSLCIPTNPSICNMMLNLSIFHHENIQMQPAYTGAISNILELLSMLCGALHFLKEMYA